MTRRNAPHQDQLALPGLEEGEMDLVHPSDAVEPNSDSTPTSPPEPQSRSSFAMGKVSPVSSETHLAPGKEGPPFPGPWAVKAVVQGREARDRRA